MGTALGGDKTGRQLARFQPETRNHRRKRVDMMRFRFLRYIVLQILGRHGRHVACNLLCRLASTPADMVEANATVAPKMPMVPLV